MNSDTREALRGSFGGLALFVLVLLGLFVLSGCTMTVVKLPGGAEYSRISVLTNQQAANITVRMSGPDAGATINGLNAGQTEAANVLIGAAGALLKK